MSLQSWKEEFYPVSAADAAKGSTKEALQHSLRKWRGLLPENLKKHGVQPDGGKLTDFDTDFKINDTTCALCQKFLKSDDDAANYKRWIGVTTDCIKCPLYQIRNVSCDYESFDEDTLAPYHTFTRDADPTPMINLITKALENH